MKGDEATPRLPVGERGTTSSQRRKTRHRLVPASPSSRRTRQCLVPAKEDEVTPRLPAGEQGTASSSSVDAERAYYQSVANILDKLHDEVPI
ncbi:hypothetical protein GW17_00018222 [Ensete ventricosum]|nr:hypothetical protein GW17_00018222 [Ensete ventricosum]